MTFEKLILEYLVENGMFQQQADAVFAQMITDQANKSMRERWNDRVEDHSDVMRNLSLLAARRTALQWIDANVPQAWYRPMFTDEAMSEVA